MCKKFFFYCVCFVFWWGGGGKSVSSVFGVGGVREKMVYILCLGRNGHRQCPPGLSITALKKTSIHFLLGAKRVGPACVFSL